MELGDCFVRETLARMEWMGNMAPLDPLDYRDLE